MEMCDAVMRDMIYNQFEPSQVAIAIILATRIKFHLVEWHPAAFDIIFG
jgi:hypothetical protein